MKNTYYYIVTLAMLILAFPVKAASEERVLLFTIRNIRNWRYTILILVRKTVLL